MDNSQFKRPNTLKSEIKKHLKAQVSLKGVYLCSNKDYVIYLLPNSWDGDEIVEGQLMMFDLNKRISKSILKLDDVNHCYVKTIDSSFFAIGLYDKIIGFIPQNYSLKDLYTLKDQCLITGIDVENKSIVVNYKDESRPGINILDFDLTLKRPIFQYHLPKKMSTDEDEAGNVLKKLNHYIFNKNNNLYAIDDKSKNLITLTDSLAFNKNFLFNTDEKNLMLFKGNVDSSVLVRVELDQNNFITKHTSFETELSQITYNTDLFSSVINGKRTLFLKSGSKSYKLVNSDFVKVPNIILAKNSNLEIDLLDTTPSQFRIKSF